MAKRKRKKESETLFEKRIRGLERREKQFKKIEKKIIPLARKLIKKFKEAKSKREQTQLRKILEQEGIRVRKEKPIGKLGLEKF